MVDNFLDGFTGRPHGNDDAFCLGIANIVKKPIAAAGQISQIQDALILLQQQKQEIQQDILRLKAEKDSLEVKKEMLSKTVGALEAQGQTAAAAQAKLKAERLDQLVVLYDAMRPADAATIMDQMSDEMVLEILPRLKDRQAARILNSLSDDKRKARLSAQLLAGKSGGSGSVQ